MAEANRVRPGPVRWVWYSFGGKLPSRHDEWVLHDVTARTWQLRHAVRSLVQVSPGLLFLLVPGPMWIKAMAILGGAILAVWYGMAYAEFTCEHRAFKQGYPLGTARQRRKEASEQMSAEQQARYAARYRPEPERTRDDPAGN